MGKDLLELAKTDLNVSKLILGTSNDELMQNMAAYHTQQGIEKVIKQLIINKRGYGNNDHDLERLVIDAKSEGIAIPSWVEENSYEISKWATTIRYNSNFKTNRESISYFNQKLEEWIEILEKS